MQRLRKKVTTETPTRANAGDFVALASNFPPREASSARLPLQLFFFLYFINRNTATVIDNRDRVVEMDRNRSCQVSPKFVDDCRLLHKQMMKAHVAGRPDVHSGRLRTASRPSRMLMEEAVIGPLFLPVTVVPAIANLFSLTPVPNHIRHYARSAASLFSFIAENTSALNFEDVCVRKEPSRWLVLDVVMNV